MRRHSTFITSVISAIVGIVAALQPSVVAQEPRRFNGVTNADNPLIEKDGRALALYMDPERDAISAAPADEADAFLTSVAAEGPALLAKLEPAKLVLKLDRPIFRGVPLRRFVLIAVYPKVGTVGTGRLRTPITFSPGSTELVKELIAKFGPGREMEIWSSTITQQVGLDATVTWWGQVGVASGPDGAITHVLVRAAVDLS
jgi:hypothetical protein